jgi:plasmid stability protein
LIAEMLSNSYNAVIAHIQRSRVMAVLTVRNLPDEVHRALRVRAAEHGRSTEAEVRDILEATVKPSGRLRLGSLLAEIGRDAHLTDELVDLIDQRDCSPPREVSFK